MEYQTSGDAETLARLNKNFYDKESIQKTQEAFKDICATELLEGTADNASGGSEKTHHLIRIVPTTDWDAERIKNEFCNHCLAISKERYPTHRHVREAVFKTIFGMKDTAETKKEKTNEKTRK